MVRIPKFCPKIWCLFSLKYKWNIIQVANKTYFLVVNGGPFYRFNLKFLNLNQIFAGFWRQKWLIFFGKKLLDSCQSVRGGHLCTKEERKERCYQNPVDSRRVFVGGHCTRQVQCTMYILTTIHSIKLNCYTTYILLCYFTMPIFIVKLKTGEVKLHT